MKATYRQVQFPPAIQYFLEKGYELRIRLENGRVKLNCYNAADYETEDIGILAMARQCERELQVIELGKPVTAEGLESTPVAALPCAEAPQADSA